jgi:hypothetical protein
MATRQTPAKAKAKTTKKPAAKKRPAAKKPAQEKLPARQAAVVVLERAGRPMHYREITKGATEEATMKTIRSYLAGCAAEGVRVKRLDAGVFALKDEKAEAKS